MPLNVQKLAAKVNDLTTEFAGEPVVLRYRAGLITPEWEAQFKGKDDGIYLQAAELIESWDVEGEKGKSYPLDLASLKQLPIEFIAHVVQAVVRDLNPNQKTSGRSGGSSFAE